MTTPRPLATKLASVMAELPTVAKNGQNSFHGYKYAQESDIMDALRGHLSSAGVIIVPSVLEHTTEIIEHKNNRRERLSTVTLELTIIDGESGDSITSRWVGQGMDQGDKAYYKAYTGAMKYAMLKTFLISTGDDPEQEEVPKQQPQQRAPRQERQPTAPSDKPSETFSKLNAAWHAIVTDAMEGDKDAVDAIRDAVKGLARVESWRDMSETHIQQMIDQWGAMPVAGRREYLTDRYLRSE